jgi:ribonucleotide reductase alpha subunit
MKDNSIDFLDEIANFIFTSKYAKYDEKLSRRETWDETVDRVLNMHLKKFRTLSAEDRNKIKWAFKLVKEKKIVPSMRSMQFGGRAIEAHNARMFNCAVRHIDSLRSFAEVFYLLLCGNGVGIGLSKKFLARLPDLVTAKNKTGTVVTYVIEDTIEGWADSLEALLGCYFKNTPWTGRKIVFDYSKIRPEGSPLKTGGGKAPGFKGLKNTHKKVKELLDYIIEVDETPRLRSIHTYDILMFAADAVLSGGVRRSATAIVFEADDEEMMDAKTYKKVDRVYAFHQSHEKQTGNAKTKIFEGNVKFAGKKIEVQISEWELDKLQKENLLNWRHLFPQRARSNNSVLLLREKTTLEQFKKINERTQQFGEPGFVFADHPDQLYNPCQPAFAKVLTQEGIKTFADIKEGSEIWSETGWTKVIKKWSTGVKKVFEYETSTGSFIGTENHKIVTNGVKIEAGLAESIDVLTGPFVTDIIVDPQDVLDGLVVGDGAVHKASNNKVHLYIGEDDQDYFDSEIKHLIGSENGIHQPYSYDVVSTVSPEELPKTYERFIPKRFLSNKARLVGFLRGLFTANGSVCGNRVTLKTTSPQMRKDIQLALSSLGIQSYFTTNKPSSVQFKNGEYLCKESYDVNISRDRKKFRSLIGFIQKYKNEKVDCICKLKEGRKVTNFEIKSTTFLGEHEVFDITVDNEPHTYWTGGLNVSNCFEVSFLPVTSDGVCGVQFCNLTSINGAKVKSAADFYEAVEGATIIGTLQAAYTEFEYLSPTAKKLTEEEALLGDSITGMMENPSVLLDPSTQKIGAKIAVEINEQWAKKIGINQAARVCVVKPEGTSSLALGSSSGIHPHHAKRYFRRVQCNKLDNVYKYFKSVNPHCCEESVWSENKTDDIAIFPIEVSDSAMVKTDLNALDHLKIIKSTQINWVNSGVTKVNTKPIKHNVSCTVIVKPDEWEKVINYLFDNRMDFAAVSLLPSSGDKDYPQAPNEAVVNQQDEEKWKYLISNFKSVDYEKLNEEEDATQHTQELACSGGKCEL